MSMLQFGSSRPRFSLSTSPGPLAFPISSPELCSDAYPLLCIHSPLGSMFFSEDSKAGLVLLSLVLQLSINFFLASDFSQAGIHPCLWLRSYAHLLNDYCKTYFFFVLCKDCFLGYHFSFSNFKEGPLLERSQKNQGLEQKLVVGIIPGGGKRQGKGIYVGKSRNLEEAIRAITVAGGGEVIYWERISLALLETRPDIRNQAFPCLWS